MRANVPTDNDFATTLPPQDNSSPQDKVTQEQKELAKIGSSPDWKIITKYLDQRIDVYKNGLFGENLAGQDTAIIGQRFLAAQSVIQEFESLKNEVEQTTKAVHDALKGNEQEPTADEAPAS